jgi:DNA-directed RNA polymerase subunit K/omega
MPRSTTKADKDVKPSKPTEEPEDKQEIIHVPTELEYPETDNDYLTDITDDEEEDDEQTDAIEIIETPSDQIGENPDEQSEVGENGDANEPDETEEPDEPEEDDDEKVKKPVKKVRPVFSTDSDDELDMEVEEYDDEEEEISRETKLVKNYTFVKPENRKTSDRLSIFEAGRVIGDRARHLENGASPYIDIKNYTSAIEIAYNELLERRIPFCIMRHVGMKCVEKWHLREMKLCKLPPIEFFIRSIK